MIVYDEDGNEINIRKTFLGECMGIGLTERNDDVNDRHVMFMVLVEDDEQWLVSKSGEVSSHWIVFRWAIASA